MTYRTRTQKPKTNKAKSWSKRSLDWLEEKGTIHQLPYFRSGYRDNSDPYTGKHIGWSDFPYKDRKFQKKIRTGAKKIISVALLDMQEYQDLEAYEAWIDYLDEEYEMYLYSFEREEEDNYRKWMEEQEDLDDDPYDHYDDYLDLNY